MSMIWPLSARFTIFRIAASSQHIKLLLQQSLFICFFFLYSVCMLKVALSKKKVEVGQAKSQLFPLRLVFSVPVFLLISCNNYWVTISRLVKGFTTTVKLKWGDVEISF